MTGSGVRATLNADRTREHQLAHERGDTVTNLQLRADHVVEYATQGGANFAGRGDVVGSTTVGMKADLVLLRPARHVVFQTRRSDVHTVMVNRQVLKYGHRLLLDDRVAEARRVIADSVDHVRSAMGPEAWEAVTHPSRPDTVLIDNPYQYSDFQHGTGS